MASPSPTSPTLADLMYNSYNVGGSINTTTFIPGLTINVSDVIKPLGENVVPNLVGYSASVDTSEVLNTSENVNVVARPTGPTLVSYLVTVSDTVTTNENTVMDKVGFTNQLVVSDGVITSENVTAVQA